MIRQVGTLVTVSIVMKDSGGNLVNTPVLTLLVTKPDGTTTAPTVTNTSTNGLYTAQITIDQANLWVLTWTSSGSVITVQTDQFTAVASGRALIASMDETRQQLNRVDTTDDSEIRTFLIAATEWVEDVIRGPLMVTTFTELAEMKRGRIFPRKRPLASVTSLTQEISGAVVDPSTYTVDTNRNMLRMLYSTYAWGWYTLVYKAGLGAIPERIKLAGMIFFTHNWQIQNGGGGLPIPGDQGAGAADVFMSQGMGFAIPNRARDLIRPYVLPRSS